MYKDYNLISTGPSFYCAIIMNFANFITIQFAFLSDKLISFFSIFSNIL